MSLSKMLSRSMAGVVITAAAIGSSGCSMLCSAMHRCQGASQMHPACGAGKAKCGACKAKCGGCKGM